MKNLTATIAVLFLALLSACNNPIIIPADVAVTLPPNQDFILRATIPVTPGLESETPTPQPTTTPSPTPSPTPSATPTPRPTQAPVPTRKSPYPVAPGAPMIDIGFQAINVDDTPLLAPVFAALTTPSRRHVAISADGQKLFLSTSDGTFLFDRQGKIQAHWQTIFTADIPCESCISTNSDGSRLAVITRNAGTWEAQVYDVQGDQATLMLHLPVTPGFTGSPNEASIAISPDNAYLAYKAGAGILRVFDLKTNLQVFEYDRIVNGISFTPDGINFVIHGGQELLLFKVGSWNLPANLLLPREDTPFAFSPDGKLVAIALPTLMRIYSTDNFKTLSEINIPPSNAIDRQWQIAFKDNQILAGYAIRWDNSHTNATIESGQWNVQDKTTLRFDTSTSTTPDALAGLWGSALTLPKIESIIETNPTAYNALRFVSDGILLINSSHVACWIKLLSGENTCLTDPDHILFASDANAFKEVMDNAGTNLVDFRSGKVAIQVGPYEIAAINRTGEWALVNNGTGADLYRAGKKGPQESVKGSPQGFAENIKLIVFTARENANVFSITVVDKAKSIGNYAFQKKDNFLYKPVLMTADGRIYYTQDELEHHQTIFNTIDPKTENTSEITRLSMPAEITTLALSSTGLFAIGQKDGAVMIMPTDGGQSAIFQAATGSIEGLAFSPDGRFLAVASSAGVRIFAVMPQSK